MKRQISELDFDAIKEQLKEFFKGQDEFKDYNYEGSALNVLMDVLAYDTHYRGFYDNMAINESFLDSAQRRRSVVSRAKELGYIPRSARASTAVVDIVCNNLLPEEKQASMTLARGTRFRGLDSRGQLAYYFIATEAVTAPLLNDTYTYTGVQLKQGVLNNFTFTQDNVNNPRQFFEIPNDDVDMSTLRVRVREETGSTVLQLYTRADDLYGVDGNTRVFFIQENYNGKYAIKFGDGVLGKRLGDGNEVLLDFLVTDGPDANNIEIISPLDPIGLIPATRVIAVSTGASAGGADRETISSIRDTAPLLHATQRRAVTAPDYQAVLKREFPEIEAISTWGGEDNNPPIYGKVFVSLKPYDGYYISENTKTRVLAKFMDNWGVVSIRPEFVDPDYLFTSVHVTVKVNPSKTTNSIVAIKESIPEFISLYFSENLTNFDKRFVYSQFVRYLSDIDPAITSVAAKIALQRRVAYTPYKRQSLPFYFGNAIAPSTFITEPFGIRIGTTEYNVRLVDVPATFGAASNGIIQVIEVATERVLATAGAIDYVNGIAITTDLDILEVADSTEIIAVCSPANLDVSVQQKNILLLDDIAFGAYAPIQTGVSVIVEEDRTL